MYANEELLYEVHGPKNITEMTAAELLPMAFMGSGRDQQ